MPRTTSVPFALFAPYNPAVQLMGDFNDWQPGQHTLVRRRGDLRSVAITLPQGEYRFRYLAEGGQWMSEPQSDRSVGEDSVIVLP